MNSNVKEIKFNNLTKNKKTNSNSIYINDLKNRFLKTDKINLNAKSSLNGPLYIIKKEALAKRENLLKPKPRNRSSSLPKSNESNLIIEENMPVENLINESSNQLAKSFLEKFFDRELGPDDSSSSTLSEKPSDQKEEEKINKEIIETNIDLFVESLFNYKSLSRVKNRLKSK